MLHQISLLKASYCILDVPLLLESRKTDQVDRVLVIDVPINIQSERVQARGHLSRKEIETIIAAQIDRPSRLCAADDIIVNDKSLVELQITVQQLHQKYITLAENH